MPKPATHPGAELEVSLTQQCGLSIERGRLTTTTQPANLLKAKSLLLDALAPAKDRALIEALARMSTLVARRNAGDDDAELTLACYVERLREYPADLVLATIADWPNRSQWWPTWFELRERLEPKVRCRLRWLEDVETLERIMNTARIAPDPEADARRQAAQASERQEVGDGLRGLVVKLADARTTHCDNGKRQRRL